MSRRSSAPPASAADTAYRHVKDALLGGRHPGGTMLSEVDVAAELGVSRTPVREAFLRLAAEGWLRLFPKRGALVVPATPGEAQDVLDARLLLEGHAVEQVLAGPPGAREELVATLHALVARQRDALDADTHDDDADLDAYADLDAAFHHAIVAAGGNAVLTQVAGTLRERQSRMVALSVGRSSARAATFVDGHEALVAAIADGDAAGFRARLAAHVHDAHGTAGRHGGQR
ncbi:MAG: GntR family transcriptional regulator [Cellulomonas iranensis]|uniref:GntR family transcriptional regulator n=1 Tax=Cellulomonas iranensis TaxID=76862 RepID=UPI001B29422A|nr:GntR family transcriptional regulator [Cellulomonas iranensis]MBO9567445.1 GntR family transcriptional regulator [Cellulomonas iranensis]